MFTQRECLPSLILVIALLASANTFAAAPRAVSADASLPASSSVDGLLSGRNLETKSSAEFLKIAFSFEPPIEAERVSVETCGSDFNDGVEFFAHPGARRVYVEGGTKIANADFGSRHAEITSLAINFRHNSSLCLKSLQFKSAKNVVVAVGGLDPAPPADGARAKEFEKRRQEFATAGLEAVIDQELTPNSSEDGKWIFRFRGDGTFFIFGRSDDMQSNGRFSAIGEFDIKSATKSRVRLLLSGNRFGTAEPWDGWHCPSPCRSSGARGGREPAQIRKVSDTVEIEKLASGGFMIRNRVKPRSRSLHFSDLRVRPSQP